jgi:hypothetical protein
VISGPSSGSRTSACNDQPPADTEATTTSGRVGVAAGCVSRERRGAAAAAQQEEHIRRSIGQSPASRTGNAVPQADRRLAVRRTPKVDGAPRPEAAAETVTPQRRAARNRRLPVGRLSARPGGGPSGAAPARWRRLPLVSADSNLLKSTFVTPRLWTSFGSSGDRRELGGCLLLQVLEGLDRPASPKLTPVGLSQPMVSHRLKILVDCRHPHPRAAWQVGGLRAGA